VPGAVPTFTNDVAPILEKHCATCHRPGQPVPFALTGYDVAKERATAIATAVESRRMPPWLPDHGDPLFVGERRLPTADIATIQRWVKAGAPEGEALPNGDGSDRALLIESASTWQLGQPDLIATMPQPYMMQPGGHDVYRNVVLRLPITEVHFVRALEFLAGDAPVHHAVIRIDRAHASRALDGVDGQPGFDGMAAYEVQDPEGHFLGWAPGRGPIVAPERIPWVLHPGSDLVVELHLMPGSAPLAVQPTVGLFFTNTGPVRTPVMMVMGSKAIDIPAGARAHVIEDRYQLPVPVEVLSVYPHAHYLGRSMDVRAVLPDGTSRRVIHIRQWSFNWQQDYRFVSPMALPAGTTIVMSFTYDNSEANPNNPHRPPRRVTWGPQSHDEMGNLGLQVLTQTAEDAGRLAAAFVEHATRIDIAGGETLVRVDPQNPSYATLLGTSYVRAGRYAEAVPTLQRALELAPGSASTENYLGGALLALGRLPDALPHFRNASRLAPGDAHLRFNLAKVLAGAGQPRDAAIEYRRALDLDQGFADAHQHLGVLLFAENRLAEALVHLRRAAELSPRSAAMHADLGGALAAAGRWTEAEASLRRALQLDPSNATARENLTRLQGLPRR
jgi:Flp pilus assembly protein TadD